MITLAEEMDAIRKKIKKPLGHFFMIIIIIMLIAIIFITVGWASGKLLDEEKYDNLADKKRRLKYIDEKILDLQTRKNEIKRNERRILLFSRLFIAACLLIINYLYMKHYKIPFDLKKGSNEMLRFNSVVVLVYSFIAFVSYGTPAKFMEVLKDLITSLIQKFSIDTYSLYNRLMHERQELITEIDIEEPSVKRY